MSAKILVVDDNGLHRLLLTEILRANGYQVTAACDGQDALEAFSRQQPDLVLLDIQMPRLDGIEVCRHIKNHPATRLTAVVLVSGLSGAEDRRRGLAAGADDFLGKPVTVPELLASVGSLINSKLDADEVTADAHSS